MRAAASAGFYRSHRGRWGLAKGLAGGLGVFLALLSLVRCFQPDLPVCSYRCNTDEPKCPDEYECRADRYCHKKGTTESCPFSMDLAPPPDISMPRDQSMPPDLSGDLGTDMKTDM